MVAATLAFSTLSVGTALADVPPPAPVAVTVGGGTIDPSVALDTAKKTACTPQGTDDEFDTWGGPLDAAVNTDPLRPEIQYVWDTYDSDVGGSALAWVPDTGCAKGVRVDQQITDVTAAPFCKPVVQSQVFSAYSHLHWTLDDGSNVLVGLNPDPLQLPVTYYGDDGSETAVTGTMVNEASPVCARTTSTVTVETNGYYLNNLDAFVWFACERDEYQILAAPPSSPQINYIDTVPC